MGLFSSQYVTQVGTSVSRVIDNASIPRSATTGALKALFQDGDTSDYMLEEIVNSIGNRAEQMYSYAEGNYTHGMPSGEIYASTQGRAQVEAIIEAAEGQQVLIEYSHFGPANALHIGWTKAVSQYGYSQATNQLATLTAAKGVPVYLVDLVVVAPTSQLSTLNPMVLEQWGTAANLGYTPDRPISFISTLFNNNATPVVGSDTATELHVEMTYMWTPAIPAGSLPVQETVSISLSGYSSTADYFQAKYLVNGVAKYWSYQNKLGTYPTLDAVFVNGPVTSGEYFPFVYFRYQKQSVITNKTTDAYKTSKKLVKYLGLDFDVMAEAVDANPDIADVEQAMMIMAVPAVSTNPVECKYLFDYFNNLHYSMDGGTTFGLDLVFRGLNNERPEAKTIVIKDAQFRMALSNTGIYKSLVAGSIGDIGTYTNGLTETNEERYYTDLATGAQVPYFVPAKTHHYRSQIAPGLYEEVSVRDLAMTYNIFGDYATTGNGTDTFLLIPIDRSIATTYSFKEREILYARSLHMVFNSVVVTKLAWYQTGVFQAILIVIAVVVSMYDQGWTLATVLSAAGIQALVLTIIYTLAVGQLLSLAFKLFVKAFGQKFATLIAIIAIICGAYQVITDGASALPTAAKLLQLSSGIQSAVISDKYTDLLLERDQFNLYAKEKTELLEAAEALLENSYLLTPLVVFGEKPEDFYNRTVHFGNIGTLGITAVSSYVDIALTLPKLNDTLGEEIYERT